MAGRHISWFYYLVVCGGRNSQLLRPGTRPAGEGAKARLTWRQGGWARDKEEGHPGAQRTLPISTEEGQRDKSLQSLCRQATEGGENGQRKQREAA